MIGFTGSGVDIAHGGLVLDIGGHNERTEPLLVESSLSS